jgi:hypothetical protein
VVFLVKSVNNLNIEGKGGKMGILKKPYEISVWKD